MNLHLLCHPAVMKLYAYDREFHTDYFNSLYTYLITNKKLADSAEILGIHRNTAAYRINKILSITDLNLEDESETPYILVSYKIVEYIKEFLREDHRQS
jgi:DNA-binding PucR family transcriptional regulator